MGSKELIKSKHIKINIIKVNNGKIQKQKQNIEKITTTTKRKEKLKII